MSLLINLKNLLGSGKKKAEEPILINILTRTSGRPKSFKICRESIENQSYVSVRHIVSYDEPEDLHYINSYNVEKIKVRRKVNKKFNRYSSPGNREFAPYNLYCNELLKKVKKGWIIFLDDDNMLLHERVLENLVEVIKEESPETLIIWQTRYPDGTLLPDDAIFKKKLIKFLHIDTACFAVHYKYKRAVKWVAWRGADFKYLKRLSSIIPHQRWIQKPFTQKNNFGDLGQRNDLM